MPDAGNPITGCEIRIWCCKRRWLALPAQNSRFKVKSIGDDFERTLRWCKRITSLVYRSQWGIAEKSRGFTNVRNTIRFESH
jgi:hypothetical protein